MRDLPAQPIPHELDLAARLWEATKNLEQRKKRAVVYWPDIPHGLANHLERVDQPCGPAPGAKCNPGGQACEWQP